MMAQTVQIQYQVKKKIEKAFIDSVHKHPDLFNGKSVLIVQDALKRRRRITNFGELKLGTPIITYRGKEYVGEEHFYLLYAEDRGMPLVVEILFDEVKNGEFSFSAYKIGGW